MKKIARPNLALLLYLFISMAVIGLSIYRPFHNWDMIGYIAAAKSFEEKEISQLHSFTYNQVRTSVSDREFESLTTGNYRYAVFTDPSAFKEQLPFYQIRPVYNFIIYLLYKIGVPIVFATHFISGISSALALMILYLLARTSLAEQFVWSMPLLSIVFGILDLARYSTPDSLAFLAYIFSIYLYLKKHIISLLILLPIIVGIRTDLLLFTMLLNFVLFISFKNHRKWVVVSILASVVIYLAIVIYWQYPGWATLFYFTLVQILTHPISTPPTLSVSDYLNVLFNGIARTAGDKIFVLYVILGGNFLYLLTKEIYASRPLSLVVFISSRSKSIVGIISMIYVCTHFLLFPVTWSRFFSAPYLVGTFSLLSIITDKWGESTQQIAPPDNHPATLNGSR